MPQPTREDVHVDAILTNISVAYMQSQEDYVATKVFPVIPVAKQSDKYYVWTKADWFRDEMQRRGDSQESAGSGMNLSNTTYNADVWALHKDLGHLAKANADVNMATAITRFLTGRALLRQEIQWVTDYFTTSVWDTDITPSNLWSDYTASDPITDIEAGKETILSNTGYLPNTLVLGYQVFRQLRHHPDFVDRMKYTSSQTITADMIGAMLEIPNVYVAKAVKNTANEGATASYAFTHGKHALLAYVNEVPSPLAPSAGYIFAWTGGEGEMAVSQGLGETIGISRWFRRDQKSERFEAEIAFDDKVVGADLGYFFNGAVA